MSCSSCNRPFYHKGSSQRSRALQALDGNYILIDEKDVKDWIVFASKFAEYVQFYDRNNELDGNWQTFFSNDISALSGTIAIQNVNAQWQLMKQRHAIMKSDKYNTIDKKLALTELLAAMITVCRQTDYYYSIIPSNIPLKATIAQLIQNNFSPLLTKIIAVYKACSQANLISSKPLSEWRVFNTNVTKIQTQLNAPFQPLWYHGFTSWVQYKNSVQAQLLLLGDPDNTPIQKIERLANHALFASILEALIKHYICLVEQAEMYLEETLKSYPEHTANCALFIAFLKLYKVVQNDLNAFTKRHLDFYYQDVLQLRPRIYQPQKAYVIAELSKTATSYELPAGTLFKAGKDAIGNDIFYTSNEAVLLNKANVTDLKSWYLPDNSSQLGANKHLLISNFIDAVNEKGDQSKDPQYAWHPIVRHHFDQDLQLVHEMADGEVGFAIASSMFYLSEGARSIQLAFLNNNTVVNLPSTLQFQCYITTAKGWHPISISKSSNQKVLTSSGMVKNGDIMVFNMDAKVPPIVAYDATLHGGRFNAQVPIVKLVLNHTAQSQSLFKTLSTTAIKDVFIKVTVGSLTSATHDGLLNVAMSNDFGTLDVKQPFKPFGDLPTSGSQWIIGHNELFSKPNTKFAFKVDWKNLPALSDVTYTTSVPSFEMTYLVNKQWSNASTLSKLWQSSSFMSSEYMTPDAAMMQYQPLSKPFDVEQTHGYLRLKLSGHFGHKTYQRHLMLALANATNTPNINTVKEPYTPEVMRFSIAYESYKTFSIGGTDSEFDFYHIEPFGEKALTSSSSILPKLYQASDASEDDLVGAFLIGLEQWQAGDSVSLLLDIMEGSSDPLIVKPIQHIKWSYLSNNEWKRFDDTQVFDGTNGLIQTGIVKLVLPLDATVQNTLMPAGKVWIRLSISEKLFSICKIHKVYTQAVELTERVLDTNMPTALVRLAPETISKLVTPIPAIKKFLQPMATFGGRGQESYTLFNTRVSERLRHKDRAITVWDFERLILEAFPSIYKVKCLNYTRYDGDVYDEFAPGHVTIITIPKLTLLEKKNALKPYTSVDIQEQIKSFLKPRMNAHATLHVQQPLFEEVRTAFKLVLKEGLAFNYYAQQLREAITAFLTPWLHDDSYDSFFEGRIHKSTLIRFIEEQPYVDYVTDVKLYHKKDIHQLVESDDLDEVIPSKACSVLVSALPHKHDIVELDPAEIEMEDAVCEDRFNAVVKTPPSSHKKTFAPVKKVTQISSAQSKKASALVAKIKNPFDKHK